MSDLTIDVTELHDLARDLKRINPLLAKNFLKELSESGEDIAQTARLNASFSTRIPRSIVRRRRGVSIRVQAGGAGAPHAAPFEHRGVPGSFRHPVFGNRNVWVSQPARPFLAPALEANVEPLQRHILNAIDSTFRSAGFHA